MRFYLFFFPLLLSSIMVAQNKKTAIVEYKRYNTNVYFSESYKCTLFIQGTTTIYLPKFNTTKVNNNVKDAKPEIIGVDWKYLKIDHGQQQILFFDAFGSNFFLVKDDYNKLNWVISEEVKIIAGYQCIKATTNFRGVDWIVWFAPEIALPYGPWKLHGLPGLIMEASADRGPSKWTIEKIEYKNIDIFDKDFKTLVDTKNKEAIPLKEFLEKQEEFHENATAEAKRLSPDSVITRIPLKGDYEQKYEWEE